MNYFKIYDNLIERSKDRTISGYYEKHHIVPKCLGGNGTIDNIANLTPEEHYLAHQLLVKMYPKHSKLIYAAMIMTTHNSGRRMTNKLFGWLKRKASCDKINYYKNNPNHSIHDGLFLGKTHSDETKDKISKQVKKSFSKKFHKKHYCFDLNGNFVKEFNGLSEAAKWAETSPSNIKYCIEGRHSHVKNYIWSYEKVYKQPIKTYKTRNRKVSTPDGLFESVNAVMNYYNFKTTVEVRKRCLSDDKSHELWYYVDGPDSEIKRKTNDNSIQHKQK